MKSNPKHFAAMNQVFERFSTLLRGKKVIVFYSNPHGQKFDNFSEVTRSANDKNIRFVDLDLRPEDYYSMDDHPTKYGHQRIADKLFDLIN